MSDLKNFADELYRIATNIAAPTLRAELAQLAMQARLVAADAPPSAAPVAQEGAALAYQCEVYRTYFDDQSRWERGIFPADFVDACLPRNVREKVPLVLASELATLRAQLAERERDFAGLMRVHDNAMASVVATADKLAASEARVVVLTEALTAAKDTIDYVIRSDKTPPYKYGYPLADGDYPPEASRWVTPREKAVTTVAKVDAALSQPSKGEGHD